MIKQKGSISDSVAMVIAYIPDDPTDESFCIFVFTTEEADLWIDGQSIEISGKHINDPITINEI